MEEILVKTCKRRGFDDMAVMWHLVASAWHPHQSKPLRKPLEVGKLTVPIVRGCISNGFRVRS